jgi:hypothetical protein
LRIDIIAIAIVAVWCGVAPTAEPKTPRLWAGEGGACGAASYRDEPAQIIKLVTKVRLYAARDIGVFIPISFVIELNPRRFRVDGESHG